MFSQQVIDAVTAIREKSKLINLADINILITNLAFMHQVITASERLLIEASREATGELKAYYISHREEERGHEAWLADDLKTAGVYVKELPLMQKAVELAGSQYYLIKHVNPACLLGYMAVLEGFPFPLDLVDKLEVLHGAPILKTLRYHAVNDIEHRKELFKMIDKFACPEILANAMQTAIYINEFAEALQG